MRILWVATKAPHPPVDGGRLLLGRSLEALAEAGHEVRLVAPVDPLRSDPRTTAGALAAVCSPRLVEARPRPAWRALLGSSRRPVTIARHSSEAVRRAVAEELAVGSFAAVIAEQLQALPQCSAAAASGVPLVLRAQNVESDIWRAAAGSWPAAALFRGEAARLARWEGEAVRRAALVLALTGGDAERLRELGGPASRVETLSAPFPAELPSGAPLAGDPPVVLFGSGDWRPNRAGAAWFLASAWPGVERAVPGAVLHVFGFPCRAAPRVLPHPAPADSAAAFPPGAVLVVPLRVASGLRMKALEAWARGVPVIARPEAAADLPREAARRAGDVAGFATGVASLRLPGPRAAAVEAGRRRLRDHHDPGRFAERLTALLADLPRTPPA